MAAVTVEKNPQVTASVRISTPRQLEAALAAVDALKAGKTEKEILNDARDAYDDSASAALNTNVQSQAREYLLAVCNLAFGDFSTMSNKQLLDCACLVRAPIRSQEEWQKLRASILKE
jgi:hypothetical protein